MKKKIILNKLSSEKLKKKFRRNETIINSPMTIVLFVVVPIFVGLIWLLHKIELNRWLIFIIIFLLITAYSILNLLKLIALYAENKTIEEILRERESANETTADFEFIAKDSIKKTKMNTNWKYPNGDTLP